MPVIKIIRSKRRNLALQILPDTTIVVKAPPFIPKFLIDKFIHENSDWIEKKTRTLENKHPTKKQYHHGEIFLFLGEEHQLHIGNYPEIAAKDKKLFFPNFLEFRIKKELENWYIKQAKQLIAHQLDWNSQKMNLPYTSVSFSDTRSKWGSCFPDNRLQFSWRLIMAPLLTIQYVIVHELVHTIEKNHSARFWHKVQLQNPSYKQQIKWLRNYGHTLVV